MVPKQAAQVSLQLPEALVSRGDVVRLGRELEIASGQLDQVNMGGKTKAGATTTKLSQPLQELFEINHLKVDDATQRQQALQLLQQLKDAPSVHISFAAEPSPQVTAKLVAWLRSNIHPQILLNIGLQPSIAAGCIIRTQSKYIDCSMRQHLLQHRADLISKLRVSA
ncbi:MAG: F0F1 ATP synthase subunit delta [Candidatus Saccharimonadales bacterium]